jgi:hypothetical protein
LVFYHIVRLAEVKAHAPCGPSPAAQHDGDAGATPQAPREGR